MSKSEEEKTFFVSRRGHQVGLNQVDLKDIDIESEPHAPQPTNVSMRSKDSRKKTIKTIETSSRSHPRLRVVIAVIVLLVVALPVAVGEMVAAQYRNGESNAQRELATFVARSVLPVQKKTTVSADQLRTTASGVNDIAARMCRGGLLDNMATLYPRAKAEYDQCKVAQTKYATLTSGLYELEAQARYLEKVGAIMKTVTTPITDQYAVIEAQRSDWLAASDRLKKLSPPAKMSAAHTTLSTYVTAVSDQWSTLNDANNTQNAAAFLEAEKKLATQYEAVREASAEFTSILKATQASVTKSYQALK